MSEKEMRVELDRLRAENAQLKSKKNGLSFKVGEKSATSLYGMGRFPVTLYKEQWLRILANATEIKGWNDGRMSPIMGNIVNDLVYARLVPGV